MGAVADPLLEGREALSRGQWEKARRAFEQALAEGETAPALEGLGIAHRWLGATGLTFGAMTRSYRLYRRAHDRQSAARVALQLTHRNTGREPLLVETSMPGVFAAGDVRHGSIARVAAAVGDGAAVVRLVHEYLRAFDADPSEKEST